MSHTNSNIEKINHKPKLPFQQAHSKTRKERVRKSIKYRGGKFDWNNYSQ